MKGIIKSREIIAILHSENPDLYITLVDRGAYTVDELKELVKTYKEVPNHGQLLFSMLRHSDLYPQFRDQVPDELLEKFFHLILQGVRPKNE